MSAKSVTVIEVTEPPYCQYNGQYEAQDVYIEIDPDGKTVSMDYDPEIGGGVPEDVYHKIIMRYYLPRDTVPTVSSANDILSNLLPLAERVVAGHSIEWNGINHVGVLDDDAQMASECIRDTIDNYSWHIQDVWGIEQCSTAATWISAETTDEEIDEIVRDWENLAKEEGAILDYDFENWLHSIRNEYLEEAE